MMLLFRSEEEWGKSMKSVLDRLREEEIPFYSGDVIKAVTNTQ